LRKRIELRAVFLFLVGLVNVQPPKTAREILLEETKSILVNGIRQDCQSTRAPLSSKIDEYILKLGYSNAHVLGVLIQLLTRGKVRVDFRDYTERLQLPSQASRMSPTQAAAVFDEHITHIQSPDEPSNFDMTQKIVVQAPRVVLPKGPRP
jgi:hypothetical protein